MMALVDRRRQLDGRVGDVAQERTHTHGGRRTLRCADVLACLVFAPDPPDGRSGAAWNAS